MTKEEFEDLGHYIGEFSYRTDKMTIVGAITNVADWNTGNGHVSITEMFASSMWGRSHNGIGTRHRVKIEDLHQVDLQNILRLPEPLKSQALTACW